ncbi:glycoside hydrolase family 15 protein [Sulfuriflexus mobilis]|uniref:glycoside hydrolase family 15 protein n=1 Tax=Sulfuriflexus mobilis TaxID=1811807 RepID=UPI000F826F7B|nr:glycoside hydrolase family 15 protein [Sulfuriflexus mobilis]
MFKNADVDDAPGAPGRPPNWCNGDKQAVGTTLGSSRTWFTIGQGILNEVYYPRVDIPQLRDMGFIVADGKGFWVEVKGIENCRVEYISPGVPAVTIVHTHPRFTLTQRIVPEPNRDVLLLELILDGDEQLQPYVLLAPHLGGTGYNNMAEIGSHHGRRMLWAQQGPFGLALAAVDRHQRDAFAACSAGYSGYSDGWQDFNQHGEMQWHFQRAGPGNVALTAALPRHAVLGLGFATSHEAAATLAVSSLLQPFELIWAQQIEHWQHWHGSCRVHEKTSNHGALTEALCAQLKASAMVLRTHQDQNFRGAMVASLSVPWGQSGEERPGYHLVWPRDLVESAGALLALGAEIEAREILRYLIATQREDGSWYQNQWLGGKPYWTGIQLDQVAFPVLLAGTLADRDALDGIEVADMAQRALGFIARHGPISPQDRWEENSGVNTFTLSVCIAALVSGAGFLSTSAEGFALELADYWNARLDDWTAVYDTELARHHGVNGYYLRIMPTSALSDDTALSRVMAVKNRQNDPGLNATEQIGVDFLQLVRYGLRDANAPLVRDTLQLVDALLRKELPTGPCWHRYTGDGYGEHQDGTAYDGTGRGRPWPLLTGERGHYELLRGADALPYLQTMAAMAGQAGMLPEQVWDSEAISAHHLYPGRPTGSAMPLAWSHAEYIKLACSILEGRPVDRPESLWARYRGFPLQVHIWYWSPQTPIRTLPDAMMLGFCLPRPATILWRTDEAEYQDIATYALGLGVHVARLPVPPEDADYLRFRITGTSWDDGKEYDVRISRG